MPTIRTLIPPINPADDSETRLNTRISQNDKRAVLGALGDDGCYEFVVATTFRRLADFIRANDLHCSSPADITRTIEFVRNGTDTRPDRDAPALNDPGTASRLQHKDASAKSKSVGTGTGSASGTGKQKQVTKK